MQMKKLTVDFINVVTTVIISYVAFTLVDKLFKLLDYQKIILVFTMLLNNIVLGNNINVFDTNTDIFNLMIIMFFNVLFLMVFISSVYNKEVDIENTLSQHLNIIKSITGK